MTISKANPPATTSTISTTAEASATASASASTNSDNQKYVDIHNTERAKYGASDLIWNNTLATAAQTWANKCTGQHSQSTLGPFGENLASGTGDFTSAAGLQLWINEASNFSASNPTYSHWTQMVWKGTTNIGCAVSECNNLFDFATYGATQYYVCEYWPAGNVIGQFR
ncbi:CAP domain-containing protein [Mycena vulgaris]|nr:CAP domain-containing protein [Mycena vulgaris]